MKNSIYYSNLSDQANFKIAIIINIFLVVAGVKIHLQDIALWGSQTTL